MRRVLLAWQRALAASLQAAIRWLGGDPCHGPWRPRIFACAARRFNPGSQLTIADAASTAIVARVAVTTTMGGASAGLSMLVYKYMRIGVWDTLAVCNGALAGLVSSQPLSTHAWDMGTWMGRRPVI